MRKIKRSDGYRSPADRGKTGEKRRRKMHQKWNASSTLASLPNSVSARFDSDCQLSRKGFTAESEVIFLEGACCGANRGMLDLS
jgi:hypothetical protein